MPSTAWRCRVCWLATRRVVRFPQAWKPIRIESGREAALDDVCADSLDLCRTQRSAKRRHVLASIADDEHDAGEILRLVQRRAAAMSALAVGTVAGQAGRAIDVRPRVAQCI